MAVFYNGNDNGRHKYGLIFIVKELLVELVKKFEVIDDRLCYFTIGGKPFYIAIINWYVSTEIVDSDHKDSFYDNLERVSSLISRNCVKILVGDWKAGREHAFRHTIGKECMHNESNDNGLR